MAQFTLLFNPAYVTAAPPLDTTTPDHLAAFKAVSHNQDEPAENRAAALTCRGVACSNMVHHQREALRVYEMAAVAIREAQQSLTAPRLAAPVVALTAKNAHDDSAAMVPMSVFLETLAEQAAVSIERETNLARQASSGQTSSGAIPANLAHTQAAQDCFSPAALQEAMAGLHSSEQQDALRLAMHQPGVKCDSCGARSGPSQRLLKCTACGWVWYCSPACQKKGALRNVHARVKLLRVAVPLLMTPTRASSAIRTRACKHLTRVFESLLALGAPCAADWRWRHRVECRSAKAPQFYVRDMVMSDALPGSTGADGTPWRLLRKETAAVDGGPI